MWAGAETELEVQAEERAHKLFQLALLNTVGTAVWGDGGDYKAAARRILGEE